MISSTFPYPPTRGGTEVRTFHLLRGLAQRHEVTLLTQRSPNEADGVTDADVAALAATGAEVVAFPLAAGDGQRSAAGKLARLAQAHLQGVPPNVAFRYSPALQTWVDRAVQQGQCDAIACEHGVNAIYVRPTFRQQVRTVLNAHSFAYGWTRNQLAVGASEAPWRDRLYLPTLWRYEQRFRQQFSRIVVTTPDDRQQFLDFVAGATPEPHWVQVVPNGVDLAAFPARTEDPGGQRLVFAGAMDAPHNIDAVCFFVEAVLPLVRSRYPEVTFWIAGARPAPAVQALAQAPGVQVLGAVADMGAVLRQATVCVLPLRLGFGIKNKTLEAMAAGVPVVGSDRALEGLPVDAPEPSALRANDPAGCAAAIDRLFEDPALRRQLSQRARSLVETHYSWEQAGAQYEQVLLGN